MEIESNTVTHPQKLERELFTRWKVFANAVVENRIVKIDLPGLDIVFINIDTSNSYDILMKTAYLLANSVQPCNYLYQLGWGGGFSSDMISVRA